MWCTSPCCLVVEVVVCACVWEGEGLVNGWVEQTKTLQPRPASRKACCMGNTVCMWHQGPLV
jgi:hypothetical protein